MSLETVETVPKQPYVTQTSVDLITRRNAAKKAGYHDNATEIDKLVHKSIRKDKQTYMKEELRSHATQGLAEPWPVLKKKSRIQA